VSEKDRNLYLQEPTAQELIEAADLDSARAAVTAVALRIPALVSQGLSELAGGPVALKPECLQRSGSFKLRGALSKLAALGSADDGIVTASAGNHGRAVAYAARAREVPCAVFMPVEAPVSKVSAVEQLGARVEMHGDSVDEALSAAREFAARTGAALVHPFDDLDVIAGQATLALELVEEVPDIARVVVPVGGGGLAAGIGIGLRRLGRDVELIGVQARACAPYASLLNGGEPGATELSPGATIADGIAIKRPGHLTLPLLRELLTGMETVGEDEIADAMVFLAERVKLVAEGAGAASVAVLRAGRLAPVAGTTVAIVSGGNVDSGLLAALLRRHDTEEGRIVRLFTRVPDRPGGLAELLSVIADARANVVSVEHVREAVPLHVRETGVELTLETRGPRHTETVAAALGAAGYDVTAA
jgi:threonine dehydratase